MTTHERLPMGSDADTKSFLVPCYGFDRVQDADQYAGSPESLTEIGVFGLDDAFAPVYRGRCSYVARMSASYGRWLTSELVGGDARFGQKPIWSTLRRKDQPKPAGAYNAALLVEGKRQFYRSHRQTTKHPKWWYRIADGHRDCFTVWGRQDGGDLGGSADVDTGKRIVAARSGRGVIYACDTRFDNRGAPCGFRTELVRVEFSILDRQADKDDVMRVQVSPQLSWSDDPQKPQEPSVGGLDDVWVQLIERAHAGFERWCKPVPEEVNAWREFFIGQRARADADSRTYDGSSFRDRVKPMDWQDALRLVQEPWQLQSVIGAHANSRFDESPGYYDANYNRVGRMLATHDCSEERRAELRQMIADFIEPADGLWNYTGD